MNSIDWSHTPLRVTGDTILYTIPVVVHILHDYGTTDISDSEVYAMLDTANLYFLKLNPDTLNIIPKFKPVASSTGICFKLANIDPNGQPTHGIEHNHTYLTNNARDQSKINQWDPMHYLNIWIVASIFPDAGFSLTGLTRSCILERFSFGSSENTWHYCLPVSFPAAWTMTIYQTLPPAMEIHFPVPISINQFVIHPIFKI